MSVYELVEVETGESFIWTLEQIIEEINRDTSDDWTDYDETDWREGWDAWCEGEFYNLIGEVKDELRHKA